MATLANQKASEAGYNNYFLNLEDLKYLPPYLRNVSDTPQEVICETKGCWPAWLKGSFVRYVSLISNSSIWDQYSSLKWFSDEDI
jgi:hypothetical protein